VKPLILESNDPVEQALLREARDYRASPRARQLALAAAVKTSWLKSLGLKIAAGVVALGAIGAWWVHDHGASSSAALPTPPAPPSVSATTPPLPTMQAPVVSLPPVHAAPVASALASAAARESARPAPSGHGSTLSEEIAAIDRARKAVYASDKAGAIRALDEYDRRFPNGTFAPEAKTLRSRADALP
jgi:TolA-binding protein